MTSSPLRPPNLNHPDHRHAKLPLRGILLGSHTKHGIQGDENERGSGRTTQQLSPNGSSTQSSEQRKRRFHLSPLYKLRGRKHDSAEERDSRREKRRDSMIHKNDSCESLTHEDVDDLVSWVGSRRGRSESRDATQASARGKQEHTAADAGEDSELRESDVEDIVSWMSNRKEEERV